MTPRHGRPTRYIPVVSKRKSKTSYRQPLPSLWHLSPSSPRWPARRRAAGVLRGTGIPPKKRSSVKVEPPAVEAQDDILAGEVDGDVDRYLPAHGPQDKILRHQYYILKFDPDHNTANWTVYRSAKARLGNRSVKRGDKKFKPDPLLARCRRMPRIIFNDYEEHMDGSVHRPAPGVP